MRRQSLNNVSLVPFVRARHLAEKDFLLAAASEEQKIQECFDYHKPPGRSTANEY